LSDHRCGDRADFIRRIFLCHAQRTAQRYRLGLIEMPFTKNKNVRIHWEEQGSGTPVVLIMGHLYSSKMWYPIISTLAAEHRVIYFDNRGTGESGSTFNASITD